MKTQSALRFILALLLAVGVTLASAWAADLLSLGKFVRVEADSRSGWILGVGAPIKVLGQSNSVISLGGPVQVFGRVRGMVICVGANLRLHQGAFLEHGALVLGGRLVREANVTTGGGLRAKDFGVISSQRVKQRYHGRFKHAATVILFWLKVGLMLATLLLGWLYFWIWPEALNQARELLESYIKGVLIKGVLVQLAMLALLLVLCVTLVGLVFVPLLLSLWFFVLMLALAFSGALMGCFLMRRIDNMRAWLALLMGLLLLFALSFIPYAGCVLMMVALVLGSGVLWILMRQHLSPVGDEAQ